MIIFVKSVMFENGVLSMSVHVDSQIQSIYDFILKNYKMRDEIKKYNVLLMFGHKQLKSNLTLRDYNIHENDTIQIDFISHSQ